MELTGDVKFIPPPSLVQNFLTVLKIHDIITTRHLLNDIGMSMARFLLKTFIFYPVFKTVVR